MVRISILNKLKRLEECNNKAFCLVKCKKNGKTYTHVSSYIDALIEVFNASTSNKSTERIVCVENHPFEVCINDMLNCNKSDEIWNCVEE